MQDYDELAKSAMEFLEGKINEEIFLATPPAEPHEPLTLDKILEAKAKLDAIGPIATKMRVPMGTYFKILVTAQKAAPRPGWLLGTPLGTLGGGIEVEGDWDLRNVTITDFSDGSREVRWCP